MVPRKKYEIQFSGLAVGKHVFDWKLEPTFFQSFDNDGIITSALSAKVELEKKERLMILNFSIEGKIKTHCDRCGDEVWIDISSNEEIVARFSNETDLTNDEVIFLDNSEYQLDVTQFFFEFSTLAIPSKRTHSEGKCAQDITEYLQEEILEEHEENNIESALGSA